MTEGRHKLRSGAGPMTPMLLLALLAIYLCYTYCYRDILWTMEHGLEFWNALFDGQIMDFYQRCIDKCTVPAVYNMSLYIVFAVWNLPCWIIGRITHTNPMSSGLALYYCKTMVLVAYFYSLKIMKRIFTATDKENDKPLSPDTKMYFYATSLFMLIYALFVGQYDIISLLFILLGIEALLGGRQLKCFVFFAIAVSMKYFAVFLIIPVILLYEKRILYIVRNLLAVLSVDAVEKFIFRPDQVNSATEYGSRYTAAHLIQGLGSYGTTVNTGTGVVSAFICIYAAVCIYCYLCSASSGRKLTDNLIYVSFVVWGSLFLIYGCCSYWLVLWVPFICLLMLRSRKLLSINILLEMLMTVSLFTVKLYSEDWVVGNERTIRGDNHAIVNMFLSGVLGWKTPAVIENLGQVIMNVNDNSFPFMNIVSSFVIVSFIALCVINFPGDAIQSRIHGIDAKVIDPNKLIIIRNAIEVVIALIPMALYFIQYAAANIY